MRELGVLPLLGVAKDGVRRYGCRFLPQERDVLHAEGAIVVNRLYASSVTGVVRDVRVGDVLDVRCDGTRWRAFAGDELVGQLTVSPSYFEPREWKVPVARIDDGLLTVAILYVLNGVVVNVGGVLRRA